MRGSMASCPSTPASWSSSPRCATRRGDNSSTEPAPSTGRSEPEPGGENPPSRSLVGAMGRFLMGFRQGKTADLEEQSFVLGGADLYRLYCRSCHGPDG